MIQISEKVSKRDFSKFHEILCSTNGRYLSAPVCVDDVVHVQYEPGDYRQMQEAWRLANEPIQEMPRAGFLKRLARKAIGHLRNLRA